MDLKKIISANLVYYLTINKERQVDLAKAINVNATAISNWVAGKAKPELDTLLKISRHYGCTVDELITLQERCYPCPFCKMPAQIVQTENGYRINANHTDECYLKHDVTLFKTKTTAIEIWNNRGTP